MRAIEYNKILDTKEIHVVQENFSPIFYLTEYPTMVTGEYTPEESFYFKYINGLKKAERCFFSDDYKYQQTCSSYEYVGGVKTYAENLRSIIKSDQKIVLTSIPSSKIGKINVVSQVVDYLSRLYPDKFSNGNGLFQKIYNEKAAHEHAGADERHYENHLNSWNQDVPLIDNKESVVLILDDVVTTGSSFYAGHRHLKRIGYSNLIFFAYGKTLPNVRLRGGYKVDKYRNSGTIDAIIFDLDQTIIDSNKYYELEFEGKEYLEIEAAIRNKYSSDFKTYDKIENLFRYIREDGQIPVIFVTNRKKRIAKLYLETNSKKIFGYNLKTPIDPLITPEPFYLELNNLKKQEIATFVKTGHYTDDEEKEFVNIKSLECLLAYSDADYIQNDYGNHTSKIYKVKPSDNLVNKAIEKIKELCGSKDLRIIGIGNSEYDIIAYKKAGIESILVQWGNEAIIGNTFNADRVFEKVEDLIDFIREN